MGRLRLAVPVMLAGSIVFAIATKQVDRTARIILNKAAEGAEPTLHFTARTVVHGAKEVTGGAEEGFHGVNDGSAVVVTIRPGAPESLPGRSAASAKMDSRPPKLPYLTSTGPPGRSL